MEILSLAAEGFRNLSLSRTEFHPRLNLLVGENGQGKTNLLEAIAVLAGRPSFRTADLATVRESGAARATLSARFRRNGQEAVLGLSLSEGLRAHVLDGRHITRLEAASRLPSVFLTNADLPRLTAPPAERRRVLDRAAMALDTAHARELQAYEKARAAKNRLLVLRNRFDADELAVYEETLATAGGRIAAQRRRTAQLMETLLAEQAEVLGSPVRALALVLESDLPASGDPETLSARLRELQAARKADERRAGRCLVGPHRDDVVLVTDGVPVAERASSGESRTLLLAWTLAELYLVARASGVRPVLAFDDFDSEWDPGVLASFAEALPEDGQIFLTSAREEAVRALPLPAGGIYRMQKGRLSREGILGAGRAEGRVRRAR